MKKNGVFVHLWSGKLIYLKNKDFMSGLRSEKFFSDPQRLLCNPLSITPASGLSMYTGMRLLTRRWRGYDNILHIEDSTTNRGVS